MIHPALARERLLTPDVLAGLGTMELIARTAVNGAVPGLHRSGALGFSQEFAEYRAYNPGDDPRFIDWNVFARTDRTYVKRFYGDTNTRLMVLLDCSASMGGLESAPGAVSKLDYGKFLSAALVHLAARQHDASGLLLFADTVRNFQPARSGTLHTARLYHELDRATAEGTTRWRDVLADAAARLRPGTLLVLISDLYVPSEELAKGLRMLAGNGHDLLTVHLLSPSDWQPGFREGQPVQDMETGRVLSVDQQDLQAAYAERLQAHIDGIRRQVLGDGGHYLQMNTDAPLQQTLRRYLTFRVRHP